MVRKFLFILVLVGLLPLTKCYSQSAKIGKFGAAAGFSPMWMYPNLEPINNKLDQFGVPNLSEKGFIVWGGSIYAYVLFVENMRLGFYGYGGSTSSSANENQFNKEAIYSLGGWAVSVEYTLPFIKKISVSPGLLVGRSGIDLEIYKNRGNFNWNNVWAEFMDNNSTDEISRTLTKSSWTISPTLNIEFPINRFISLRAGGGYHLTLGGEWKIENDQSLSDVPEDLNGNAAFIQLGLFFGFLAF